MGVYTELEGRSLPDLILLFHGECPDGAEYNYAYYTEVAEKIVQQGTLGIEFLRREIDRVSPDRQGAMIFALSGVADVVLRARLEEFLNSPSPLVRMDAIDALAYTKDGRYSAQILLLRDHESPYVRAAVLRYVARMIPQEAASILTQALQDSHYIVRMEAIDQLDESDSRDAVEIIRPLLNDESPEVRQAAATTIENLTT